jgi:AAA+ superfamily predicted ATPase
VLAAFARTELLTNSTQPVVVDADKRFMNEPFLDHEDLVESWLATTVTCLKGPFDDRAFRARLCATSGYASLPTTWLRHRLGLTETEERILWILIAHELAPEARQILRGLNTENGSDTSFDTLRRIVYGPGATPRSWRELGPDGRLRRLSLIERTDGTGNAPEQRQTFKVTRRVLALVHGDAEVDTELNGIVICGATDVGLPKLVGDATAIARIEESIRSGESGLTLVHGRTGSGRRSLLTAIASQADKHVLVIEARAIAPQRDVAQRQLRTIARECRLLDRVPLLQHIEALGAAGETPDRLDLVESELEGLVLATSTRLVARRWKTQPVQIELPPLTTAQRASLWQRALPQAAASDAELLATMYPLAPALIDAAGAAARRACGDGKMQPVHIETGIRSVLDDRLAGLATRVTVTQTWEDLVLPEDQTTAIVELLARIRERPRVYEEWGFAKKLGKGLGVSALFSGPPGTGKTMTAGLIARDLGIEVYQVDLSKIVSKWIGETEKNLAALFDAAEAGHAILLFDEADALFGKRSDVKSSNDRHANQEVNYLLQRMESFTGICILTTNHETAIDEAFRRRLSVHVKFPVPEADERKRLWRAMIPTSAPMARDLAFDRLADTFAMSGGYIRNAVVRAAFLAADEKSDIGQTHLVRAARLEYEAMGKVVSALG